MSFVRIDDHEGVTVVTLTRPPANALDPALVGELLTALEQLDREQPAAVVLAGSGGFFSGGADLRVVPELSADEQAQMVRDVNKLFSGWHAFPRPVVSAVNGHAVAGGLVLALCGDYRVASASARYGLTEAKVGIPFPSAAMEVVQTELSAPVARRLVLGAELIDSSKALAWDVVDEVVTEEAVLARALGVAHERAHLPPSTYELVKRRLRAGASTGTRGLFGAEGTSSWDASEAREAAPAVLEDRQQDG
jgi:enoyl-CoA hydratase/carnithine racemase